LGAEMDHGARRRPVRAASARHEWFGWTERTLSPFRWSQSEMSKLRHTV